MLRPVTSASNVFRRQLCPGSERLEAGLPEEDSIQSKEGTLLHSYDANTKLSRAFLKPEQQRLLKIAAELDERIFQVVSEQFGISADEPFGEGRETALMAESPFDDGLVVETFDTPGHCDRWRYYPVRKLLIIIDKKFGYKVVTSASANYQLRTYAIGASGKWVLDNAVVAITQPRLSYDERITLADYSKDEIEIARTELAGIRLASTKPDAPLVPGEEQCRYCKAKLICSAYQAQLAVISVPKGDGTVAKRTADAERSLAECSDQQLEKILIAIQFSEFIKDLARDEGRRRVQAGTLTSYQLGKAKEVRKIADAGKAVGLLTLAGHLTKDEALDCCDIKIGDVEDKIRAKAKCTWDEARHKAEGALSSVLERSTQRPSLTRKK